jgi:hypothetical protein
VNRFPVVEASGSAYDMGYAHGAQAADLVERYLRLIEKSTGRDRAQLAEGALTYVPRIEALSPAYLEETRGLADGAGLSFDEAMICQVRGAATQAIGAPSPSPGTPPPAAAPSPGRTRTSDRSSPMSASSCAWRRRTDARDW